MPDYRRWFVAGGTYFFTVVTCGRAKLFASDAARELLGKVYRECARAWPFETPAIVLLPDHLHAIWTLPPGDANYSARWSWIKKKFTRRWLAAGGTEHHTTTGTRREQRRGIWQRRYWEHTIEDEDDFERHFDYIHFNPVKHGYVGGPYAWRWSSFHRWVKAGVYDRCWGADPSLVRRLAKLSHVTGEPK
jgi:putative transposase